MKNFILTAKRSKNVNSKNELKTRPEALIHSFERLKSIFQYEETCCPCGWVDDDQIFLNSDIVRARCAHSKYGLKNCRGC